MTRLTVTLCGSLTRAATDLARVHRALALAGHLVHAPCPPLPGEAAITGEQLDRLTERHYEAIRQSDLVIAVIPDGRPGNATHYEMRYAKHFGKAVRWVTDVDALVGDVAAWLDGAEVPA
ncbi:hypothetical protein [Micromonospora sp. NPDC023814]|uniref:hypothetical protein n=1 Tax=Micromonospora sp. NPDC023814 TaxID=3154596 RepID=UPI00340F1D50